MEFKAKPPSPPVLAIFLCCICFSCLIERSHAQPTTDPSEVKALNSIFQQWDISADNTSWNISGEPCTGDAVNAATDFENPNFNPDFNPAIQCDCTSNSGSTCHITHLRVYELGKEGQIPEELANLTYLNGLFCTAFRRVDITRFYMVQGLGHFAQEYGLKAPLNGLPNTITYIRKLDKNNFRGPLPGFLGELTRLKYLSVGHNLFSGTIPKELGSLLDLRFLAFGTNNFSGPLPQELGNLIKLEEFYIDSSGVGGEIPSTFVRLQNMKILWAPDNLFTGKIPDFISNWTNLKDLRLQGNSFEGPIPSSFSSLTSMTNLRISELSNFSSSLDFIKDMKDLSTLVLRNSLISGNIPSGIGDQNQNLQRLDLSFNNLTGPIPSSLFNLSSLSHLFLGNNSLSGPLPSQKSQTLLNIDLSYNELSGSFPSWVTPNSQWNLVANNFVFDSSNISVFPGLDCLQKNFPCNRDSPRYANFSIKCGGKEMRSTEGVVFEADDSTLGPASYYVVDTKKWAVSNAGLFFDRVNADYIQTTQAQIYNTSNSEMFQTARLSPGSLRYYGLGLENGNYTVNLHFAETRFDDGSSRTWQSLGRRVFDIYIQGILRLKDFDIRKQAGGVSNRAVKMDFEAPVSENYLEIHLFWAGKGTCCIPIQGYYGPSISAISVISEFQPTVSGLPPTTASRKKNKTGLIVGILVSVGVVSFILIFAVFYLRRERPGIKEDEELLGIGPRPNTFSYAELRTATEDFNPENKLGEGGFGPVYKGTLLDGRVVAVKKLSVASHQGKSQFIAEIATISAVQHRNLVKLYGCCIQGDKKLLVYEYLENRSLDQALFGKSCLLLDWPTRYNICLETARGLAYLHEESRPRIVHRDVKASNILLDADLSPKISDFGLAKLYDDKNTHITTRVAGTIGYLAPEYAMRGHLTEKADVFGFGVVALEILSGRPNSDTSLDEDKIYLLEWAWTLHENNRSLELVDPKLTIFDKSEAIRVIRVALLCTQASPMLRPPMSRIVAMLAGDIEVSTVTSRPGYLTDWQFNDITSGSVNDSIPTSSASRNTNSQLYTSTAPSMVVDPIPSPINFTRPMLHETFGEGR